MTHKSTKSETVIFDQQKPCKIKKLPKLANKASLQLKKNIEFVLSWLSTFRYEPSLGCSVYDSLEKNSFSSQVSIH